MKFAVPVDASKAIYSHNPCTAPKFAVYTVHYEDQEVYYALVGYVENPWNRSEGDMVCDPNMRLGECSDDEKQDLKHVSEHYAVLEAISGCSYLLVQSFCENTKRSMRNAGVKLFQIPPFITKTDKAIKNFLIGAKIADSVEHVHHAS